MVNSRYHLPAGGTSLLNKHITTLDGFRGLAILLVTGYHYFHFFNAGWVGVDLFFVLSGFLITGKLIESVTDKHYFRTFYLKRILRIVPLYFTVLLLFFWLLPLAWPSYVSASMHELLQQQVYYWSFTANFYDAVHGWPVNISLIHCWSLCCEMQFYLLWPFVVYFFYSKGRQINFVFVILLATGILFRIYAASFFSLSSVYRYVLLPCRLDAFCAGALLYLLVQHGWLQRYKKSLLVLALTILMVILVLTTVSGMPWHFSVDGVSTYGYTLNAAGWACLLGFILTTQSGIGQAIFSSSLLTWFGKYSYGIYVFHLPVYIFTARLNIFNSGMTDKSWPLAAAAFAATCVCSLASYHLLEKYFLSLKPATVYAKD